MKYVIGIVLAVLALVGFSAMNSYNGFVSLQEGVDAEWSNVETQYQRRYDLIPNLVATVQGAADFEKETLTAVTEARASAFNAMQAVEMEPKHRGFSAIQRCAWQGHMVCLDTVNVTQKFKPHRIFPISRPNLRELKIGFQWRGRDSTRRFKATTGRFGAFRRVLASMFGFESKRVF